MSRALTTLLVAAVPASALASDYEVSARRDGNSAVVVEVMSTEVTSKSCALHATQIALKAPPGPGSRDPTGRIRIDLDVDMESPCTGTFGQHRGAITLGRGPHLPSLVDGTYRLVIDKVNYGNLVVADGVLLEPPAGDESPDP